MAIEFVTEKRLLVSAYVGTEGVIAGSRVGRGPAATPMPSWRHVSHRPDCFALTSPQRVETKSWRIFFREGDGGRMTTAISCVGKLAEMLLHIDQMSRSGRLIHVQGRPRIEARINGPPILPQFHHWGVGPKTLSWVVFCSKFDRRNIVIWLQYCHFRVGSGGRKGGDDGARLTTWNTGA